MPFVGFLLGLIVGSWFWSWIPITPSPQYTFAWILTAILSTIGLGFVLACLFDEIFY